MPKAVRKGDEQSGICNLPCQEGSSQSQSGSLDKSDSDYSPNVFINGEPAVREGDLGSTKCPCDGEFEIIEGSPNVFINGEPAVREGDKTKCKNCDGEGIIDSGSANVFIN